MSGGNESTRGGLWESARNEGAQNGDWNRAAALRQGREAGDQKEKNLGKT